MKFHSLILDEFFDDARAIRKEALSQTFKEEISPYDNHKYPDLSLKVSDLIRFEMKRKLEDEIGKKVFFELVMFRMTKKNYSPYLFCHTDNRIAPYSAIIYLNEEKVFCAGTETLDHDKGLRSSLQKEFPPIEQDGLAASQAGWQPSSFTGMRFNRCFLFRADLFHRALPPEGFGQTNESARLILISWLRFGI